MTAILGISAHYHDAAAAVVVDGELRAAAEEERFSRVKHDASFPVQAIAYCLEEAGLEPEDLDFIGFYEKPMRKFERILKTTLAYAPRGLGTFLEAMPLWLKRKLHMNEELAAALGRRVRKRPIFAEHHESHAASAFYPSPFDEAAILTVDGVGEWTTTSFGVGRGREIELWGEQRFPHSLGLLYAAVTAHCGFRVNSDEYKIMGLAPYGAPRFAEVILNELIDLKPDGSLRLDPRAFRFGLGKRMATRRFDRLLGGPPRHPEAPITDRERDLAASIQTVTEQILLLMARYVSERTGQRRLCLAGGVALNCVANERLLKEGPFEQMWIQPAAGDSGGAVGVALLIWHRLLERPREPRGRSIQNGSLLGPWFEKDRIRQELGAAVLGEAECFGSEAALVDHVAGLLAEGRTVGWFQGRMEFGPRALGARSILADPRDAAMSNHLNRVIKRREPFRPFAPAVTREAAGDFFELVEEQDYEYMLITARVKHPERIAAVTHIDSSARVQVVDDERQPRFAALLRAFGLITGVPALLNTSFNDRDEPIVRTPTEAHRRFLASGLDVLVIDRFVWEKQTERRATRRSSGPARGRADDESRS